MPLSCRRYCSFRGNLSLHRTTSPGSTTLRNAAGPLNRGPVAGRMRAKRRLNLPWLERGLAPPSRTHFGWGAVLRRDTAEWRGRAGSRPSVNGRFDPYCKSHSWITSVDGWVDHRGAVGPRGHAHDGTALCPPSGQNQTEGSLSASRYGGDGFCRIRGWPIALDDRPSEPRSIGSWRPRCPAS
jgi:hypothetical protein